MKTYSYKSFQDFIDNLDLSLIYQDSLIISDIDGVFFKNIIDPRWILGVLSKESLLSLEALMRQKPAMWLFTNRLSFFKYFPFVRQFRRSVQNLTDSVLKVFTNSNDFLKHKPINYALILNAKKPGSKSQQVVEKGIDNFKKVIYIGAKDLPFYFTDERLLKKLEQKENLDNLTFIKISPFKS
ncbi:MAG: hypothetical protein ABIE03_03145 [Patescibacteria group bacterium]|nr:hypothetical protein [Patescibacteria group bacterium]